ncbi:MAG: IPExxxVDY family protein [Bacteroidota bacterium]
MKKTRLTAVYDFDFELIGIVSTVKEYKLAWNLNQLNLFHLVKADDIKIDFTENRQIHISNLIYEDDFTLVHLLRNKLVPSNNGANQYLIQELSRFDYLLKVKNLTEDGWAEKIYEQIRDLNFADYVTKIELDRIKHKENLLF